MERSDVMDAMGQLKLYGMRAAYDEIIQTALSANACIRLPAMGEASA